jgi:hypothetical protein
MKTMFKAIKYMNKIVKIEVDYESNKMIGVRTSYGIRKSKKITDNEGAFSTFGEAKQFLLQKLLAERNMLCDRMDKVNTKISKITELTENDVKGE